MESQTQTPLQKREAFKKRMIAQGKLPQVGNDKKQIITKNNFNAFEAWTHYNK